jgi:hypothetical protein
MKPSIILFSAGNLIGFLLIFDSVACIVHQVALEQRNYYDASDSITFLAMTVILLCSWLNVCWGIKAMVDVVRRRDYRNSIMLAVMLSIWCPMVHRFFK